MPMLINVFFCRNLKSSDKPSEYGYKFYLECSKNGYKRKDHWKFFHDEFMKKVVGRKKDADSAKKTTIFYMNSPYFVVFLYLFFCHTYLHFLESGQMEIHFWKLDKWRHIF